MSISQLVGKKTAILGLGREGQSTLNFLKKNKIKADVLDIRFDNNYLNKLTNYDIIFRTPGFPRLHPKLIAAEKRGAEISSQIKLFFDLCPAKIIGVTGTKGKTTTVFLINNILKNKYGNRVFMAGNFGKPALDILSKLKKNSLVILELSSFQIQDLAKSPDIAVITNITKDHMDPSGKFGPKTHQNLKEYFEAKLNIIRYQKRENFAIINPSLKKKTKNIGKGKKVYPVKFRRWRTSFAGFNRVNPAPLLLEIPIRKANRGSSIPQSDIGTKLKGLHNLENIALAAEVGKIFRVPQKNIFKATKKFKGIEHRLEFVSKVSGVSFYNDSAATNPDATLAGLKSFKEPVYLILGGSDKGLDYKNLANYINKNKNIKSVALIGQLKEKLYKIIDNQKVKRFKNLKDAVLTLFKKAGKNSVVLLSPGAASFDMFESYAQRGDEFKKIVKSLKRRKR